MNFCIMFTFKKGGAVMKEGIRKEYKKQYDTSYRRLLCIYDFMKYAPKEIIDDTLKLDE